MKLARPLRVVGWREWVGLETFGVEQIKAKVDTGARTCALHAFGIEVLPERDGAPWVRFAIHPEQHRVDPSVEVTCPLAGWREVRSSDGWLSRRPVVRCRLRLGGLLWTSELTLVRRDLMGFRMLLGRRALRRRFVVDSGASFVGGVPLAGYQRLEEPPSP